MKKVMFALAIAGMFSFVACNNTPKTEEPVEEAATEIVEEAAAEATATVEEVAAETAEVVTEEAAQ